MMVITITSGITRSASCNWTLGRGDSWLGIGVDVVDTTELDIVGLSNLVMDVTVLDTAELDISKLGIELDIVDVTVLDTADLVISELGKLVLNIVRLGNPEMDVTVLDTAKLVISELGKLVLDIVGVSKSVKED